MQTRLATLNQIVGQFAIDTFFRLLDVLGYSRIYEDQLHMCWSTNSPTNLDQFLEIPKNYQIVNYSSKNMPDNWLEVYKSAGLKVSEEIWGTEFFQKEKKIGIFLLLHRDKIVGSAGLRYIMPIAGENALITYLAVHRAHWGKRLGNALVAKAMLEARERKLKNIFLSTDDHRLAAIKTYASLGFIPCLNSWDQSHHYRWLKIIRKLGLKKVFCKNVEHRDIISNLAR